MLDLSRPLELDDGTPVRIHSSTENRVYIFTPKVTRNSKAGREELLWYYSNGPYVGQVGLSEGQQSVYYTIRSVGPAEPEEYEGWFVA